MHLLRITAFTDKGRQHVRKLWVHALGGVEHEIETDEIRGGRSVYARHRGEVVATGPSHDFAARAAVVALKARS